jgi:hypothetical protein
VIKLRGTKEVLAELRRIEQQLPGVLAATLYQEGLAIDALSTSRMPVDTGRMRATHYVTQPLRDGESRVVEVGCATDYAVYVHERTDAQHPTGQAKFLQSAFEERASGFIERLAKRAFENLKKGVRFRGFMSGAPSAPHDPGEAKPERKKKPKRKKVRR